MIRLAYETIPAALVASCILFADTLPDILGSKNIVFLMGNLGTVAVLVWYVIYDVRVRTPKMLETFTKEQNDIRDLFQEEQAKQRETFAAEQRGLRENYRAVIEEMRKTFSTEQRASREHCNAETAELRKMLMENMAAMRNAVHDVRNTAHEFLLRKADEERKP